MSTRRLLTIASISLALIATAVIGLVATDNHDTTSPAPPSTAEAIPTASASGASPSHAPTTDLFGNRLEVTGDDAGQAQAQDPSQQVNPAAPEYLSAPPAGLRWQRGWGGAALPVSVSDGPARIEAGVASGFADTPQGAALAALDAVARALAAPDGVWQQVVRSRFHGGGPALIDRFARSRSTPNPARYIAVPDGVRVLSNYQPDFAVVQIAVRASDGWTYGTWPMAWVDGDWRVRVPDDIDTFWGEPTFVDTLTGFGQWSAPR
ncbi:hypothetical protein NDR87_14220 [Nocardia sp. CDC159]|uniref:DUF8175 domain-containing protein n=1 Tax=Nocardia pulmonis TaxID=2951408 RepID=A0A9X2E7R8_9NOCA|nr:MULTISPECIES: hypothetical protein [Nocardia]MCM6774420.1 hypothetical protein [Nocardia pulmonis]MCM6787514.1 hypothetical protein [Nocardia sp. CDC159]